MHQPTTPDLTTYVPRIAVGLLGGDGPVIIDGTVLFADLSGFTRIAERLAAQGREGCEQLTSIVNGGLTTVLSPVLALGGDVLSFGGDSTTVLFTGAEHEAAAVASAVRMQRALDALDGIETGAGRVRLRMSVGVAAGAVTIVPVGVRHQSLLLLGDAVSAAVDNESSADAGQIHASLGVVGAVPEGSWKATEVPSVSELRWRRWRGVEDERLDIDVDVARPVSGLDAWVAPELRGQLGGAPSTGELRRTVVGFVRAAPLAAGSMTGTDAVDRASRVADAVESSTEEFGVCWLATDVCVDGVTFLLTAGAPTTREDDVDRMHHAVAAIVSRAPHGSVRIGMELGTVFAGDLGHPQRRCWTVMGDSVNVAARLSVAAGPGQILAGRSLASALAAPTTDLLRQTAVKGRRDPVEMYVVRSPTPARSGDHREPPPIIGRDDERFVLLERWAAATRGRGAMVELVGDAGIGKTRLLEELQQLVDLETPDAEQLVLRPETHLASVPYAIASELVRRVAGVDTELAAVDAGREIEQWMATVAPHLLPWASLVADAAGATLPPSDAVARLDPAWASQRRHAVVAQLVETARPHPWLLALEDLQWVDDASRALLAAIAELAPAQPWLVVVGRRRDAAALVEAAPSLELDALGDGEARRLVLAVAGGRPLSDSQVENIVASAAGNPLYLEQLAAHATAGGADLPDTIERLVAARIDTLDPADRQLLRDTAVVGRAARLSEVARLLGDDTIAAPGHWERLRGFVDVVGDVVRFRSELTRTVAHDGLPYARRRQLHRAMAQLLADHAVAGALDDDDQSRLAGHLLEAGDADAAWPVAVAAARAAVARFAWDDAADLYVRALSLVGELAERDVDEVATAFEEAGDVHRDRGDLAAALEAYAGAASFRSDPIDQARLCDRRARVEQLRGELRKALLWGTRGLRLVEERTDAAALALQSWLAQDQAATRNYQGRNAESLDWAIRAREVAATCGDATALAHAAMQLEVALSTLGDPDAAEAGAEAIRLAEELSDLRLLGSVQTNVGLTAYNEGRWADALEHYEQAAKVAAASGNESQSAAVTLNRGFLLAAQGEIDEAAEAVETARRVLRASGQEVFVGFTDVLSSKLAAWRRDLGRAAELLATARMCFESHDVRQLVLDCDVAAVELLLVGGRNDEAVAAGLAAVTAVDEFGPAETLPIAARRLLALAQLRVGDLDAARASASDAVDLARSLNAGFELALALDVVAHAQSASGEPASSELLTERDDLLAVLGVRRTLFPLAR